jgi:hypothetical protein
VLEESFLAEIFQPGGSALENLAKLGAMQAAGELTGLERMLQATGGDGRRQIRTLVQGAGMRDSVYRRKQACHCYSFVAVWVVFGQS